MHDFLLQPFMSSPFLTTQQAAQRLGLTPGSLQELSWLDDGLPIVQQGLQVHYRLEDLQAFEQREVLALLRQVIAAERPLPLIRSIARSLGMAVTTRGTESHPQPVLRDMSAMSAMSGVPAVPRVPGVNVDVEKLISLPQPTPPPVSTSSPQSSLLSPLLSPLLLLVPSSPPTPPAPTPLNPNLAWYLVHTKARQEASALTHLTRQSFKCYLPMIKVEKIRSNKSLLVQEALFPSYVFIELDTSASGQSWSPIRSTLGVRGLVRFGGQPAKVDAQLIAALRAREAAQRDQVKPLFSAGDKVVVTDGPFAGIEAIYQSLDAERRSMILLGMLSKPVQLRIGTASLRQAG